VAEDRGHAGDQRERKEERCLDVVRGPGKARREKTGDEDRREPLQDIDCEDDRAPSRAQNAERVRRADVPAAVLAKIDAAGAADQEPRGDAA
jgi:hypothetical protein